MRRADRLFALVQAMRAGRLRTAAQLAQALEVVPRTIYRDVADLQRQGVPIEGEAGVGYRLRAGHLLAPLMFRPDEARALAAASRMARPWVDAAMARAMDESLDKLLGVMPPAVRVAAESLPLHAPRFQVDPAMTGPLGLLLAAIGERQVVRFAYLDAQGRASRRRVRPLACFHWGAVWTLGAWCEGRSDFRNFRFDRMRRLRVLPTRFHDEPGRTLADLKRAFEAQAPAAG